VIKMPLEREEHKCEKFPKGYTDLKIEFFKEAISGWNWNLMAQDSDDSKFWTCYHIKFCPFCGKQLEDD